jgi:hypothetical protein
MKVAICFSGHIRDLEETKNFWIDLIKKYDMDVYASLWDVQNEELGDTINNFERIYSPKRLDIENYEIFKRTTQDFASMNIQPPSIISAQFQKVSKAFGQLPMYYKIWRANLLSKQLGVEYDLVIRARLDTILDESFELIANDYLNVPMGRNNVPAFSNSEGLNDCFAYGKPKIMDYYSFLCFQMMEYLNSGHYVFPPEHFLAVHFSKIKIDIRFFPSYLMITRVSRGKPHEIYNSFMKERDEYVESSEFKKFLPDPQYTFRKSSIIDDFVL